MTRKKENNCYELLCLFNEIDKYGEDYEKLITSLEAEVDKLEKQEKKDLKPVYLIKKVTNPTYVLINFTTKREKVEVIKNQILKSASKLFLNRYKLVKLNAKKG